MMKLRHVFGTLLLIGGLTLAVPVITNADANTVLLLHMDGSNGSTTFVDDSNSGHTVTAVADAQVSTAQSKFGGASGLFDGASDRLSIPSSSDFNFGTGDYTIDFWARLDVATGNDYAFGNTVGGSFEHTLQLHSSGVYLYENGATVISAGTSPSVNTWQHIAIVRSGTTVRYFLDGVEQAQGTSGGDIGQGGFLVGSRGDNSFPIDGYLDEFRVSKGVARWTSNFTPPSSPYKIARTKFSTNVTVTDTAHIAGTVSKGSGTFMIDHPLDPKNKLLYHSFVESPEVKNIYDGVLRLDKHGEGTAILPHYFLALNKDFRYLGTSMGDPMPNLHVKSEVYEKRFWFGLIRRPVVEFAGGTPHGTISWQVTGNRKDPFITANPIIPEIEKGPGEIVDKGECIFEPLCL